ncbi:MAG TPA: hypothetical protein VNR39_02845 [Pseudolabrys sp.]|nr:hypothetical protein [Pseudolabrys sp.]
MATGFATALAALIGFATAAGFFADNLAARGAAVFTALFGVLPATALRAVFAPPRRTDLFAATARLAPARALLLTLTFAFVLALVLDLVLAFVLTAEFRFAAFEAFFTPAPRAFLARAAGRFALDRDEAATLDLLDFFLAMVVAAGKGFRRASQSEVMI